MPAYAYAITIKRKKQTLRFDERHEIAPPLTLEKLAPIVGGNTFTIQENDEIFSDTYILTVHKNRLETDEERKARIDREKRYMTEYKRQHKKQHKKQEG